MDIGICLRGRYTVGVELDKFIEKTLVSIKRGVRAANVEVAKDDGGTLGNDRAAVYALYDKHDKKDNGITFDVAVTVSTKGENKGGGRINVVGLSLGGEISDADIHERVSRIKFAVMPRQDIV